jgi:folate-binding protein YgfZ
MATARSAEERAVIRVAGDGARDFLHDLVTTDVVGLAAGAARYGALLTPQGKYLADFVMIGEPDAVLIDVDASQAAGLTQRLIMYRLRRKIAIGDAGLSVVQIWGDGAAEAAAATGGAAVRDPRGAAFGWRVYAADAGAALVATGADVADRAAWDALRVAEALPEPGTELGAESYVLEFGFERLGGVDFRKGCYVGQEIVARMKHKTELRKGMARVAIDGDAGPGAQIINADGKPVGVLGTVAGGEGLAHLRFDRADGELRAGDAVLRRIG